MLEAFRISDGVDEDDSVGALVEGFGDVPEPFLSGGVPDVEGGGDAIDLDSFDFEVDADGAEVLVLEGVFAVAEEEAGFADSAVADDEILDGAVFRHQF